RGDRGVCGRDRGRPLGPPGSAPPAAAHEQARRRDARGTREMTMALPQSSEFGRCPCGGEYDPRFVEVRMTVGGGVVVLTDVQQGGWPECGSRVYKARTLEGIEAAMRGARRRAVF